MDDIPQALVRLIRKRGPVAVFEARDGDDGKLLVRRLDRGIAEADPVGIARFRREQAIAKAVSHPGIATCMGTGEEWLAFEWLESGLDDSARQARFRDAGALRRLVGTLAGTLAYLHARGIVHADIKPEHVRFRSEAPVLVDFGIAAIGSDDPLFETENAGSPRWMAPEILSGAVPSPTADIWSLCAVAAWLWDGAPPPATDAATILRERGRDPLAHVGRLDGLERRDGAFHAILAKGLGKANDRPSAARLAQLISSSTAG